MATRCSIDEGSELVFHCCKYYHAGGSWQQEGEPARWRCNLKGCVGAHKKKIFFCQFRKALSREVDKLRPILKDATDRPLSWGWWWWWPGWSIYEKYSVLLFTLTSKKYGIFHIAFSKYLYRIFRIFAYLSVFLRIIALSASDSCVFFWGDFSCKRKLLTFVWVFSLFLYFNPLLER